MSQNRKRSGIVVSVSDAKDAKNRIGVAMTAASLRRGDGIQAVRAYRHAEFISALTWALSRALDRKLFDLDGRKEKNRLDRRAPPCRIHANYRDRDNPESVRVAPGHADVGPLHVSDIRQC